MAEINLKELAKLLQCSLPTAQKLIADYQDFPIIQQGGPGKQWRFDADAVCTFLEAKRAEEQATLAARNEALAQLTLPIGRKNIDGDEISIDDKLKAAKLRQVERDELKETRFLVPTLEVRAELEKAFRRYGQIQDSALTRVCAAHNLPEAVKRALQREFAEARTAFVQETQNALAMGNADDEPLSLFA